MIPRAPLVALVFVLPSCSEDVDPNAKPTFPVTGTITVDGGAPGSPVKVMCHNEAGIDPQNPTVSWCLTKDDGGFALNTYNQGDGVPLGKYRLTFEWGTWNPMSNSFGGEDRLNGRYKDEKSAAVEFAVDGSGTIDLGTIELTTKD